MYWQTVKTIPYQLCNRFNSQTDRTDLLVQTASPQPIYKIKNDQMYLFQSSVCWDDTPQPPIIFLTFQIKNMLVLKKRFDLCFYINDITHEYQSFISYYWWILYLSKIIRIQKQINKWESSLIFGSISYNAMLFCILWFPESSLFFKFGVQNLSDMQDIKTAE